MPPKKETAKKPPSVVARPNISDSSLLYVPNDAVEGFTDRINTGVEWTLTEQAARHHKEVCQNKDIPKLLFSEALQNKLEQSILNTILNTDSKLSLEDYWELILPTTLWDHEKFDNDAAKICFRKINSITDNIVNLIKTTCKLGERRYLMRSLKKSTVLRLNDTKMTDLDEGLLAYKHLLSLNLCGNYIEEFDDNYLPDSLKTLELHANRVRTLKGIAEFLPRGLIYLGLSRNLLDDGCSQSLTSLPYQLTVLDMSDNDIYDLEPVLTALEKLPNLVSLALSGNPCSVCAGYARMTMMQLPRLHWLDYREVLPSDRPLETLEIHPDDLRASYFYFTVFRVMSAPQPPKTDKGAIALFHVELELPLLDSQRRQFLMFRRNESLVEMLPPPEDDSLQSIFQKSSLSQPISIMGTFDEQSSHASDIYKNPVPKNSREVLHYRVYESNRVPWAKIMNFQEPAVKIFCPDLVALRDTFRSVVTIRLVYTLLTPTKVPKDIHKDTHKEHKEKKPTSTQKVIAEQRVVLAEVRCALKQPDWSHPAQHFHWDNSMESNNAIHWGDGDLSAALYSQLYTVRTVRGGGFEVKNPVPEDLTMQVGFHIESLRH